MPDCRIQSCSAKPSRLRSSATNVHAQKPWQDIPDVGWNRKAVELWHAGYKASDIARGLIAADAQDDR